MLIPGGEVRHRPALLEETVGLLALPPGGVYWDLTLGDGGHARAVLQKMETTARAGQEGRMIGMDRDPYALKTAGEALSAFSGRIRLVEGRLSEIGRLSREQDWPAPDGVLADLGTSTRQLKDPARGFSFMADGPLDMRMNPSEGRSAAELVNTASREDLERIFRELGQERWAGRISRAIVARRPFSTTGALAEVVTRSVPGRGRIHPATRVFQALRMTVNDELGELASLLETAPRLLKPGGILAVISFHSLEDGMVKRSFRSRAKEEGGEWRILTKKAILPSRQEEIDNPRARSARLRGLLRVRKAA